METFLIQTGRRGFSLVELVVSLFLAALVLTLGVRLLREAQIVFLDWQRMAPQPVARLSEALLRADVQSAIDVRGSTRSGGGSYEWSTDALILAAADGRLVRYDSELGQLVRSVEALDESETGARTVLRRVSSWRWRRLPGGVVEIHLIYAQPRDPGSRIAGSRGLRRATESRVDSLFLRYAMRGRPGRQAW